MRREVRMKEYIWKNTEIQCHDLDKSWMNLCLCKWFVVTSRYLPNSWSWLPCGSRLGTSYPLICHGPKLFDWTNFTHNPNPNKLTLTLLTLFEGYIKHYLQPYISFWGRILWVNQFLTWKKFVNPVKTFHPL